MSVAHAYSTAATLAVAVMAAESMTIKRMVVGHDGTVPGQDETRPNVSYKTRHRGTAKPPRIVRG